MTRVLRFWGELPTYFKIILFFICLVNLAGFKGYQEVNKMTQDFERGDNPQLIEELAGAVIQDGRLEAKPNVIKTEQFDIAILSQPTKANYILFDSTQLTIQYGENENMVNYESNGNLLEYLNTIIRDFALTTFTVQSFARLLLILLIVGILYICAQLIFKVNFKRLNVWSDLSLMLLAQAISYLILYTLTQQDSVSFIVSALIMGIAHVYHNKIQFNHSFTKMYLGEGV